MPTEEEKAALWAMLWEKYTALNEWEHAFNLSVPVSERPNYEGFLFSVQAEKEQLVADMEFILHDAPIPFPSEDDIARLQASTGALAATVRTSNNINELLKVATEALQSWPISSGG